MSLQKSALELLKETSRTFYIPISRLPEGLQAAVTSGYLCMRAIDEIEDHPTLANSIKAKLLREVSVTLQGGREQFTDQDFATVFQGYQDELPEVSLRVAEWASLAPASIAPRIWESTAAMADRMAYWADRNWAIHTETDLDRYTFSVAGSVGLLLCDLWDWYDSTKTDRTLAIGFGRGLQAVNIIRNHGEDKVRGVTFMPTGWTMDQLHQYAQRNLHLAAAYNASLPPGPALDFCQIPLALAQATLMAMMHGMEKLTRSQVMAVVEQLTSAGK
jgi:farnesyl-diphosphate farnesyltransferase